MRNDHFFPHLSQFISAIVCLVSITVLVAWIFDIAFIQSLSPQMASMKFNTALCFLLCGAFLIGHAESFNKRWLRLLPVLVLLIAGISLVAYWVNLPFSIDELVVQDIRSEVFPGRMSQATAVIFILLANALLFIDKAAVFSETLAITSNLLALLTLFAYLFNVNDLYQIPFFSTIALHTAMLFWMLSVVVIIQIDNGLILPMVLADSPAGELVRIFMPIALIIPLSLGWVLYNLSLKGFIPQSIVFVLFTLGTSILLAILTLVSALRLEILHRRRVDIEAMFLQSELQRVALESEQKLVELRERFNAMLYHDMRNPLASILLSSETLLKFGDKLDEAKKIKNLKRIHSQGQQLSDIIEDVLLLSKMQSVDLEYNPSSHNIQDICQEIIEEIKFTRNFSHQLIWDRDDNAPDLFIDKKLMRRLLINLIGNAIKYSPEGDEIRLSGKIYDDNTYLLSISDQGIGIPKEDLETIFEPYNRAKNTKDLPGFGLGLALVKHITEKHGGTIRVESEIGKGATFFVLLPLKAPSSP